MQANEFELEYMRSFLESYEAMSSIPEDYFDVHTAEELGISESVRAYMSRERHVHERRMMQKNDPERYAELLKKEAEERDSQEKEEFINLFGMTEEEYDEWKRENP